jgi:transcriptional regulator GlxA family with amidase domain
LFQGCSLAASSFFFGPPALGSRRSARAYRFLTSPRHAHRKIADIAFAAGFGDVSHFDRMFRCRYGRSPSEVRD